MQNDAQQFTNTPPNAVFDKWFMQRKPLWIKTFVDGLVFVRPL